MKKAIVVLLGFFGSFYVQSQELIPSDSTKVWTKKGNFSLLFNQSNFNNWVAGGENTISGNVGVNYDFNYKKNGLTWDNKIIASYGLVRTKNAAFEKKTDDRLEFNSLGGKNISGNWYFSVFINFRTQMAKGYIYGKDPNGAEIRSKYTNLFSPGYLTFGPGLLWKKSNNLKFNLAPITSKITIVDSDLTLPDEAYFGVKEGRSARYELGFYASGYYKFTLMANVSLENTLNVYSNYLDQAQNIDVDYQLNVVMKINKYLATNLALQTIYDDNAFRGFQTRQVFGLGVNFGF
jgi:hypothetical protein